MQDVVDCVMFRVDRQTRAEVLDCTIAGPPSSRRIVSGEVFKNLTGNSDRSLPGNGYAATPEEAIGNPFVNKCTPSLGIRYRLYDVKMTIISLHQLGLTAAMDWAQSSYSRNRQSFKGLREPNPITWQAITGMLKNSSANGQELPVDLPSKRKGSAEIAGRQERSHKAVIFTT